jgi:diguanylate cyclase (GGDEF)-like protein
VWAALAGALMEILGVEQVHVLALDRGPSLVYGDPGLAPESYQPTGGEAPAWVAANGTPVVVDSDRAAAGLGPEMTGRYRLAGAALLPFSVGGELRAVVALGGQAARTWSPAEIELAGALLDVAGLAVALAEVAAGARVDRLTGVLNGEAFDARLAEEVARARRGHTALAVAMVALDDLPELAEHHGAPVAEAVLRHVAELLGGQFRATDQVGRVADGSFAVILPAAPSPQSDMIAERVLRLLLATRIGLPDGEEGLAVSVGLTEWRPAEAGPDLLARAFGALREAQASGGDRVVHAT